MTDKEAMKLALEALERLTGAWQTFDALDYGGNAITALKERLAQPELLRRIHSELLNVLKSVNELEIHHDGDHFHELLCDVEAALADQEFILHDEENEGGWSDWVCPKPDSYLMKCCDCGLVHEMQTRVAKYEPKPSDTFVVPNDPDLQTQFRMRRHEVLKTTPPQRTEQSGWRKVQIDDAEEEAWKELEKKNEMD
jgi:hypothetical protein